MFAYDFMRMAFAASALAALLAGAIGYFLVLRGQTFAGHALAHVGFTGAAGAVLVGVSPLAGMVVVTVLAGLAMGALGERLGARDVAIGMTLSVALGLGVLCLHFYTAFASQATALLFGNVLGVDWTSVEALAALSLVGLVGLAILMKPLLFASLHPDLAEARGVPVRGLAIAFLALTGAAVAAASQIVGVLLVFTLMVGPAAAAGNLTARFGPGLLLAVGLAVLEAWGGLALAWATDWPVSSWIAILSGVAYVASLASRAIVTRALAPAARAPAQ